jgi:hypothetical protein
MAQYQISSLSPLASFSTQYRDSTLAHYIARTIAPSEALMEGVLAFFVSQFLGIPRFSPSEEPNARERGFVREQLEAFRANMKVLELTPGMQAGRVFGDRVHIEVADYFRLNALIEEGYHLICASGVEGWMPGKDAEILAEKHAERVLSTEFSALEARRIALESTATEEGFRNLFVAAGVNPDKDIEEKDVFGMVLKVAQYQREHPELGYADTLEFAVDSIVIGYRLDAEALKFIERLPKTNEELLATVCKTLYENGVLILVDEALLEIPGMQRVAEYPRVAVYQKPKTI